MSLTQRIKVKKSPGLVGRCVVPGDKSISHRALMFGAIAQGKSRVSHFLNGSDCLATAQVMRDLGIDVQVVDASTLVIEGKGRHGLMEPKNVLDSANSGTTIRLMCGLLSAQNFFSVMSGSEQIRRRPMGRVIAPLQELGAHIHGRESDRLAPIAIAPSNELVGKNHVLDVASAQVKSALILAALYANGETIISEPGPSRDHSERLLSAMGAKLNLTSSLRTQRGNPEILDCRGLRHRSDKMLVVSPLNTDLNPFDMKVPGDASSAAFLIAASLMVPGSQIKLSNVSINSTRDGFLEAVKVMGAKIELQNEHEHLNEPIADMFITFGDLKGSTFSGDIIVRMIDELPILAVLATQARGETIIKDAKELKVKETNRIDTTVSELRKMGAKIEALEDGFVIEGPTQLKGAQVTSHGDHRLAMAMTIAGLCAEGTSVIDGAEVTVDSFPGFVSTLCNLGADVSEETL